MDNSPEQLDNQKPELEREQAKLEEQLIGVNRKLIEARRKLGQIHNSRISGSSVFPAEVLAIIFETLHQSQNLDPIRKHAEENITPRIRSAQQWGSPEHWKLPATNVGHWAEVVVSHVCHKWRVIALQTPSLWAVFSTSQDAAWNAGIISETKRLRTYLWRSGKHDLKLYFRFRRVAQPPTEADGTFWTLVKGLLNLALGHIERWKHFTLFAPRQDSGVWDVALTLRRAMARLRAPKLERLIVMLSPSTLAMGQLNIEGGGWDAQVLLGDGGQSLADPCPSLKHLKLDRVSLVGLRPPLRHITELILDYGVTPIDANPPFLIDWSVLITEILRLPNLEAFSLCDELMQLDTYPGGGAHWAEYGVDMPKLKHLRLTKLGNALWDASQVYSSLHFLIRYITAPQLETLTLYGFNMLSAPWGLEPRDWLEPSYVFPSLHSLSLVEFRVMNHPRTCAVFRRLAKMTSNARTLLLSYGSHPPRSFDSVISMLLQDEPWTNGQILRGNSLGEGSDGG
ncbi:hypothetical protein DFP72DRAFT_1064726 [Ephemerocybe angulata]|uniref:F-box domain-containing protein n=1 Tax=Ephemerocybe angulata TaxID=980116 RepID=A0A8H6MC18_9AGAR|nr:hypothetical protein DFP72DRAFT_1064726 [Tulosesus angulatus]